MSTNNAVVKEALSGIEAIKAKQKATWEDGDYAAFARFMQPGAIEILDNWDIAADQTLLDVACGAGQTAIPAAKKGINVTGVDIAENLIQHARKRASETKLNIQFEVGDAEDLPYPDGSFDVAMSMVGAMFAPRPDRVAKEFARAIKPGGKLYMVNWTPHGMPAQMFKCVLAMVPPPAGFISPALWGDEETVIQRLADNFTDIKLTRKLYPQWQFPFGASEVVDLFRTHYGPVKRAFDAIDQTRQKELRQQLEQVYLANSEYQNGVLTVTGAEYLEVIAIRR